VNCAMATAGGSGKFFEFNGRRYSHIIDPATGRPVEHTLASVTVAANTCMEADGWDTPLLVLGSERGFQCAERNGIAALFVSAADDGQSECVRETSAWRRRFQKNAEPAGKR
jgi:FAD:protein FMN transferase